MADTPSPTGRNGAGHRLLRYLPPLALLLAIAALVLLAVGPLGWRAGWWHFRLAFQILMPWAFYCGLGAIAVALAVVLLGRRAIARRQLAIGAFAFLLGVAIAYVPWHYNGMRGMCRTTSRPISKTRRPTWRSWRCARPTIRPTPANTRRRTPRSSGAIIPASRRSR